jgi:hypothetical protein
MKQRDGLNDELAKIVADVLRTNPEDWGDVDARVLYARILRLEARLKSLEDHHRAVHPRCGEAAAQRAAPLAAQPRLKAVDRPLAA